MNEEIELAAEQRANEVLGLAEGRPVTRRNLALLRHLQKNQGTAEVRSITHPHVVELIDKGLAKQCRLRAGPLGLYLDEPGITFTPLGRSVIAVADQFNKLLK